jgi:dinuclear metal center YbgI/SA1388 family protein
LEFDHSSRQREKNLGFSVYSSSSRAFHAGGQRFIILAGSSGGWIIIGNRRRENRKAIIMRLANILTVMEEIAPTRYAEPWDNVGLLAGDPEQTVRRLMLTIDYTNAVAREAKTRRCDCVIAYHPPIFEGVKRLTAGHPVFESIRQGIALYSPHTALDVAEGGTNDVLADIIGLTDRAPLRAASEKSSQCKLVVFVPQEAVEKVSTAIFHAGAGRIGNYASCSFRSAGTGTFYGLDASHPVVGRAGKLEEVSEIRLESVVPLTCIDKVVQAMRQAHPYEEPAFDLVQLAAAPSGLGLGRIGVLSPAVSRRTLFNQIKRKLGVRNLLIAGKRDGTVRKAAVAAGACGDLLNDAIAQKADLLLTGEMRHHEAIRAAKAGMTVICALHSNSERVALKYLRRTLERKLPDVDIIPSQTDQDPFVIQ